MRKVVWIVGAGALSETYVDVIRDLGFEPLVIGRGATTAEALAVKKNVDVVQGGLESFLSTLPDMPFAACVVTGVEALASTTGQLIVYGVKDILCEKPGALNEESIHELAKIAADARCIIGYNRRCYAATQIARDMLASDGGVTSFHFEFTEWSDRLFDLKKAPGVMAAFALGNSSHVMDLAFFLGGFPEQLSTTIAGQGKLDWHPSGSAYAGSGISTKGAIFSYIANWDGPGRWGVEVTSKNHRFIFRPMEELWVVKRGTVASVKVDIDDVIDQKFKHGMHLQIKRFLTHQDDDLCTLQDQVSNWITYKKIAGY